MTTSISTPNSLQPAGATGQPGEAQLRAIPAAAAGASGTSPQPPITPLETGSVESLYYFLDSAQTTSPQVLPVLNLAPPGFEPPLGFTAPSTATAADPRGLPGRTAAPGQHFGSTSPATPGVELGSQPFVPRVPPASAFGPPSEESLRGAPAAAAGAAGVSAQPLIPVPEPGSAESLYYFLESVPPTSPRTVPAVDAGAVDPGFGALPKAPRTSGEPLYFVEEVWRAAKVPSAPEPESPGFRPELAPATGSRSSQE